MACYTIKEVEIDKEKKEVTVNSAYGCGNYFKQEDIFLSNLLKRYNERELNVWIIQSYEQGDWQGKKNKYIEVLEILRKLPKYKKYDWRLPMELDTKKRYAFLERRDKSIEKIKKLIENSLAIWETAREKNKASLNNPSRKDKPCGANQKEEAK